MIVFIVEIQHHVDRYTHEKKKDVVYSMHNAVRGIRISTCDTD